MNRLRDLWDRLTARHFAALALVAITVAASTGTYLQYLHAARALKIATDSRNVLRRQRTATEYEICRAVNRAFAINDRDRETFIRSLKQSKNDLRILRSQPVLRSLILAGIKQTKEELRARPYLRPLRCIRVIEKPEPPPPELTTTTS